MIDGSDDDLEIDLYGPNGGIINDVDMENNMYAHLPERRASVMSIYRELMQNASLDYAIDARLRVVLQEAESMVDEYRGILDDDASAYVAATVNVAPSLLRRMLLSVGPDLQMHAFELIAHTMSRRIFIASTFAFEAATRGRTNIPRPAVDWMHLLAAHGHAPRNVTVLELPEFAYDSKRLKALVHILQRHLPFVDTRDSFGRFEECFRGCLVGIPYRLAPLNMCTSKSRYDIRQRHLYETIRRIIQSEVVKRKYRVTMKNFDALVRHYAARIQAAHASRKQGLTTSCVRLNRIFVTWKLLETHNCTIPSYKSSAYDQNSKLKSVTSEHPIATMLENVDGFDDIEFFLGDEANAADAVKGLEIVNDIDALALKSNDAGGTGVKPSEATPSDRAAERGDDAAKDATTTEDAVATEKAAEVARKVEEAENAAQAAQADAKATQEAKAAQEAKALEDVMLAKKQSEEATAAKQQAEQAARDAMAEAEQTRNKLEEQRKLAEEANAARAKAEDDLQAASAAEKAEAKKKLEEEAERVNDALKMQKLAEEEASKAAQNASDANKRAEEELKAKQEADAAKAAAEAEAARLKEELESMKQADQAARQTADSEIQRLKEQVDALTNDGSAQAEAARLKEELESAKKSEEAVKVAAEAEATRLREELESAQRAQEVAKAAAEAEATRLKEELESSKQAEEAARQNVQSEVERLEKELQSAKKAHEDATVQASNEVVPPPQKEPDVVVVAHTDSKQQTNDGNDARTGPGTKIHPVAQHDPNSRLRPSELEDRLEEQRRKYERDALLRQEEDRRKRDDMRRKRDDERRARQEREERTRMREKHIEDVESRRRKLEQERQTLQFEKEQKRQMERIMEEVDKRLEKHKDVAQPPRPPPAAQLPISYPQEQQQQQQPSPQVPPLSHPPPPHHLPLAPPSTGYDLPFAQMPSHPTPLFQIPPPAGVPFPAGGATYPWAPPHDIVPSWMHYRAPPPPATFPFTHGYQMMPNYTFPFGTYPSY